MEREDFNAATDRSTDAEKLEKYSGDVDWSYLAPHFRRGNMVYVDPALDLKTAGLAFTQDDKDRVRAWLKNGDLVQPSSPHARHWEKEGTRFNAMIVRPFVLAQPIEQDRTRESSRKTVAVVDVGSNSIKLLVARAGTSPGSIQTEFSETIETRISAGIGGPVPRLNESAFSSGIRTIEDLLDRARAYTPANTVVVATSAVRDAANQHEFVDAVRQATGLKMRVLTGDEEAGFVGRGLATDPNLADVRNFVQVDLGGGSLELVHFKAGRIDHAVSLPLGAVRMTERFIEGWKGALNGTMQARIQSHARETIVASTFSFPPPEAPLIATGGAFTVSRAVLAARTGQSIEERSAVLSRSELGGLARELCALPLHERLSIPHLPAARADIIPAALLTIDQILQQSGRDRLIHSFFNLRYGIAAELLEN